MSKHVNRFVISDTHFGHTNSWEKFKLADGCTPLRPFTSTEEMDETMVERWNAKVKPGDTVYHLGDVVINAKSLHHVSRLNGRKILIAGNHDIFKNKQYFEAGFAEIRGCRVFTDQWILTHIPLHPASVTSRFRVNVHGHYHANEVMTISSVGPGVTDAQYTEEPDPRYLCVSVEHTNFEPLHFDEVEARIQARWAKCGYEGPSGWGNGHGPG